MVIQTHFSLISNPGECDKILHFCKVKASNLLCVRIFQGSSNYVEDGLHDKIQKMCLK